MRLPLSYRAIGELLGERGIKTCYEGIQRWVPKFVSNSAVTPFLLTRVLEPTGGRSLAANIPPVRGAMRLLQPAFQESWNMRWLGVKHTEQLTAATRNARGCWLPMREAFFFFEPGSSFWRGTGGTGRTTRENSRLKGNRRSKFAEVGPRM